VEDDRDVGLLDQRPEAVEHRVGRGPALYRPGPDVDQPRSLVDHPFQFTDGTGRIDERRQRHAEHPAVLSESPVLRQPPVERLEIRVGGVRVVDEVLLHRDPERREEHSGLDALLLHERQPGVAVAELGDALGVDGVLGECTALGLPSEIGLQLPRRAEVIMGRDGCEVRPALADEDPPERVAILPHDPDRLVAKRRRDVACEAVVRLVVMVVGVHQRVVEACHRGAPRSSVDQSTN
jgi:hypothetical protein